MRILLSKFWKIGIENLTLECQFDTFFKNKIYMIKYLYLSVGYMQLNKNLIYLISICNFSYLASHRGLKLINFLQGTN